MDEAIGEECIVSLLRLALNEAAEENATTRMTGRAGARLIAGMAGDIRRLRLGFIK